MTRRAILLDRDGTLVHPYPYPSRPEHLRLFDHVGDELARLQAAGFALVVITNQSGLARGDFTEADLERMHEHLRGELAGFGASLAGIYYCPHHEEGVVPEWAIACDCRKPNPGLLLRAAAELALDLERSWFIGDILDDIEAGQRVGCRSVLVDLGTEAWPADPIRQPDYIARDARHALQIVQALEWVSGPPRGGVELTYWPTRWPLLETGMRHERKDGDSCLMPSEGVP